VGAGAYDGLYAVCVPQRPHAVSLAIRGSGQPGSGRSNRNDGSGRSFPEPPAAAECATVTSRRRRSAAAACRGSIAWTSIARPDGRGRLRRCCLRDAFVRLRGQLVHRRDTPDTPYPGLADPAFDARDPLGLARGADGVWDRGANGLP